MDRRVTEVDNKVNNIADDLETLKLDMPILPLEADRITEAVKKKGLSILGGKESAAYVNKSIRQSLYSNLYANLKYNFGVRTYKSIKRSQCDNAIEIIQGYKPPFFLEEMINNENRQHTVA